MKRRNRVWLELSRRNVGDSRWLTYINRERTAIIYKIEDTWICVMYESIDATMAWTNKNLFLVCNQSKTIRQSIACAEVVEWYTQRT